MKELLCEELEVSSPEIFELEGPLALRDFGLLDSHMGIIIAQVSFSLAFSILLFHTFFSRLPKELIESAKVDGATHFTTFWRLVIPVSVPALASSSSPKRLRTAATISASFASPSTYPGKIVSSRAAPRWPRRDRRDRPRTPSGGRLVRVREGARAVDLVAPACARDAVGHRGRHLHDDGRRRDDAGGARPFDQARLPGAAVAPIARDRRAAVQRCGELEHVQRVVVVRRALDLRLLELDQLLGPVAEAARNSFEGAAVAEPELDRLVEPALVVDSDKRLLGVTSLRQILLSGSVKLGPDQIPDLWAAHRASCARLDLPQIPDVYLTQFFHSRSIVGTPTKPITVDLVKTYFGGRAVEVGGPAVGVENGIGHVGFCSSLSGRLILPHLGQRAGVPEAGAGGDDRPVRPGG